jgi:hypothetical protein
MIKMTLIMILIGALIGQYGIIIIANTKFKEKFKWWDWIPFSVYITAIFCTIKRSIYGKKTGGRTGG